MNVYIVFYEHIYEFGEIKGVFNNVDDAIKLANDLMQSTYKEYFKWQSRYVWESLNNRVSIENWNLTTGEIENEI